VKSSTLKEVKAPSLPNSQYDNTNFSVPSPHVQHRGTINSNYNHLEPRGRASTEVVKFHVNNAYTEEFHDNH